MKRCKLCDGQIRQTKYEGFCYQCWHDNDGDYGGMVGIIECQKNDCDCECCLNAFIDSI
jgi:hypothetical protein